MPTLLPAARRAYRWHRPLMVLAAASVLLLVACVVGLLVDHRVLTGVPIWLKPGKFALSVAIYAYTLAWLVSLLHRGRRLGAVLGTIVALMLAGELVVIVVQVVRGHTSHFNFSTPADAVAWESMGAMIVTLWLCSIALAVLLLLQRQAERSVTWALRSGMVIAVVGMALAYLMTVPTSAQLHALQGGAPTTIIGAHSVGLPDGGPGLPLVGWSTVGGDLRIPHFVGLHGLQVMIVLALVLAALGRRYAIVASDAVRLRLVAVTAVAYAGVLAILTWQALRGQSIVHPDAPTAGVTTVLAVAALTACAIVLRPRHRSGRSRSR